MFYSRHTLFHCLYALTFTEAQRAFEVRASRTEDGTEGNERAQRAGDAADTFPVTTPAARS